MRKEEGLKWEIGGRQEGEEIRERKEKSGDGDIMISFWNVAGLRNKDREFWRRLREWEVIILMETWVKKKGWKKIRRRLPDGYVWKTQAAKRKYKKGRA